MTLLMILGVACQPHRGQTPPVGSAVPAASGASPSGLPPEPVVPVGAEHAFVGSQACAECHPKIHREHAASLHSRTVRSLATGETKAREVQPFRTPQVLSDPALGVLYSYAVDGKGPVFRHVRTADKAYLEARPKYVIGSGHLGYTYLLEWEGELLESRTSHYAATNKWEWTPGQHQFTPNRNPMGEPMPPQRAKQCFLCHSTMVAMEGEKIRPEQSIFQVGCERCHGPGKEHVTAIREKRRDTSLYAGKGVPGSLVTELCGTCHRSPKHGDHAALAADPDLPRFAASALTLSRCFTESAGKLSCSTCHDPHQKVGTDQAQYVRACRSCHDAATPERKPCPVNPKTECVTCHMPAKTVGLPTPLKFHQHWIK